MCALTPRQGRDWFGSRLESAATCRAAGCRKIRPKSFLLLIPARSGAKTCANGRITATLGIDRRPWSNEQLAAEGSEPAPSHLVCRLWPKNSRGRQVNRPTQLGRMRELLCFNVVHKISE